ncbi:hypothetical protein [Arcanobacterium buesumense]|uniref:DUF2746 domain-containing protein n=1 Tax=Arcanobacterium buesumense TaxID=2722751 RepID=A0A6H2ELP7_9ACTO|nr:hypothetical protein [Arcanobacterium buesumense]QJC21996.1 hypothetical protein HC352_05430 [Arcanobacterium buesumense]
MNELAANHPMLLGLGQFLAILGFIGASAWSNYKNMRESRKTSRKLAEMQEQTKELKNNHGSSLRDVADRIELKLSEHDGMMKQFQLTQNHTNDVVKSVSHQVGEVRRDLSNHAERITNVERSAGRNRESIERVTARFDALNDELH